MFSRDVTGAMLVSLNKGTAAMLVFPTNPLGIELYSLLFWLKNMLIDHVSENTPFLQCIIIVFFSIYNIFYPGSPYVHASTFCRLPANQNQWAHGSSRYCALVSIIIMPITILLLPLTVKQLVSCFFFFFFYSNKSDYLSLRCPGAGCLKHGLG